MPRTSLNTETFTPTSYHLFVTDSFGTVVNDYGYNAGYAMHSKEVRVTSNTPGFRGKRSKDFLLPMNPFSYTKVERGTPNGRTFIEYTSGQTQHAVGYPEATFDSEADLPPWRKTQVDHEARTKLLLSAKGMKVNLGNVFATRKQTSDLAVDVARRWRNAMANIDIKNDPGALRALLDVRKGKIDIKKIGERFSSDFLALQYGIIPLLSDVYESCKRLEASRDEGLAIRVSSKGVYEWKRSQGSVTQWNYVPVKHREAGRYHVKYIVYFTYSLEHVAALASVGITNPLAWAWEVLPWSFVVDWFLKVGDWIDTFDATVGLQFLRGCVTTFEQFDINQSANGAVQGPYGLHGAFLKNRVHVTQCVRTPLTGFPVPALLPSLGNGLSFPRVANALALILQRSTRK